MGLREIKAGVGLEDAFRDSYKVTMVDIENRGDTVAELEANQERGFQCRINKMR